MVLNTKRIHNFFSRHIPERANKCLQKFHLSARKRDDRSVITCQNCNEIVGNSKNELKIIILVLNYLTVLVCSKATIHLSVGG